MPFPPNWFANIAAPHVGVPLSIFFIGTFFGVAGPSLIHVQAGLTINNLTGPDQFYIFSWTNVGALVLIGVAVLIPVWIKRRGNMSDTTGEVENGEGTEEANFSNQGTYGTFPNSRTEVSQIE